MKKTLLLSGLLAGCAVAAGAFVPPTIQENSMFQTMSPNGQYVVSDFGYGMVVINDLVAGSITDFLPEGEVENFSIGLGNCMSNTGVLLCHTSYQYAPTYWDGSEWKELDHEGKDLMSGWYLNGITPDGSRICGSISNAEISLEDDNTMLLPAVWDRKEDGSYGPLTMLPVPETDLFGGVPQYITANYISADGKVVGGQVVDCTGKMHTPIVYIQDNEGNWTYKLLVQNLFNPDGIQLPENPGDAPDMPQAGNYMSEDEIAQYEQAYSTWASNGYEGPAPMPSDFMTDENKAAYDAAMAAWDIELNEWNEKYTVYADAFDSILASSPDFVFNNVILTPDGTKYVCTGLSYVESETSWWPEEVYTPWVIDIADGAVVKYETEESIQVFSAPTNDIVMGTNGVGKLPMRGFVLQNGNVTLIEDYLSSFSSELATWIDENMKHSIEIYDFENDVTTTQEMLVTGLPCASSDLSVITVSNDAPWASELFCCGYIFEMKNYSGVQNAVADTNIKVKALGGTLHVEGDFTKVEVYDIAGRCVFVSETEGEAECSVNSGVYIVKATTANGVYTTKVAN